MAGSGEATARDGREWGQLEIPVGDLRKPIRPRHTPTRMHTPNASCSGGLYVCRCSPPPPAEHEQFLLEEAIDQELQHIRGLCTAPDCEENA